MMQWTRRLKPVTIHTSLAMILFLIAACARNSATGQVPVEQELPLSVTSSGFTVSLISAEVTSDKTVLTFRITDAEPAEEPAIDAYAGLTPPDLTLEGLTWGGPYIGSYHPIYDQTSAAQPPPIVAAEEVVELGPVTAPAQPVSISFSRLRFMPTSGDHPMILVNGDWTFRFTPNKLGQFLSTRLAVGMSVEAQGITFTIYEVVIDGRQTAIRYQIDASLEGTVEQTGIVIGLADGALMLPDRTNRTENGYLAVFSPLPAGQTVTIALSPLLVEVPRPLQVSFPVNGRAVAGSPPGTQVPVNAAISVAGEQLLVTSINRDDSRFTVRINNDQPDQSGTVLLRFPGKEAVDLTDDRGNAYQFDGAETNFGKSDPLNMWAEGSSFSFIGALSADATELTLRVASYGQQLRGPWAVTVAVPEIQD